MKNYTGKSRNPIKTIYETITERVIELLEKGVIPWHKPWNGEHNAPRSLISKKTYRGINSMLTGCSGYMSPYWITYKQAKAKGGSVKRGEKGTPCIFWQWIEKSDPETGEKEKYPILKHYTIFNVAQCDGIDAPPVDIMLDVAPIEKIDICESIVRDMPRRPDVRSGLNRAFYSQTEDFIGMPDRDVFASSSDYYGTLFHEMAHSTKHPLRLNRRGFFGGDGIAAFGGKTYAAEELVAEFCATFLCGFSGIETATIDNSAAYIKSWIKTLRDDSKLLITAAGKGQKAADYILGVKDNELCH